MPELDVDFIGTDIEERLDKLKDGKLSQNEAIALGIAIRQAKVRASNSLPRSERLVLKKKHLLQGIDKALRATGRGHKSGEFTYPDIVRIGLKAGIAPDELGQLFRDDEDLKAKISDIEELCLQDCRRTVFSAKSKAPYLALNILQLKNSDFAPKTQVTGSIAHFHLISHVRTNDKTKEVLQNTQEAETIEAQPREQTVLEEVKSENGAQSHTNSAQDEPGQALSEPISAPAPTGDQASNAI